MKVLAALLGGALTLAIASGKCAAADSIEGVWRTFSEATGAERAWVRVERTGDVYEGSLVRLFRQAGDPPEPVCSACSGALRDQPLIGMVILRGLRRSSLDEYDGGSILDPENGQEYRCQVRLVNSGRTLEVRGYVGFSVFGRTQSWARVGP